MTVCTKAKNPYDGKVVVLFLFACRVNKNIDVHALAHVRLVAPPAHPLFFEALHRFGFGVLQHLAGKNVRAIFRALFCEALTREKTRFAICRAVYGCGVNAGLNRAVGQQLGVSIKEVVAGADHAACAAFCPQGVRQAQALGSFFDLVGRAHRFWRNYVVIHLQAEMAANGLAFNHAPRFNRHFLGVGFALYKQAIVKAPDRAFHFWVVVKHIWVAAF